MFTALVSLYSHHILSSVGMCPFKLPTNELSQCLAYWGTEEGKLQMFIVDKQKFVLTDGSHVNVCFSEW